MSERMILSQMPDSYCLSFVTGSRIISSWFVPASSVNFEINRQTYWYMFVYLDKFLIKLYWNLFRRSVQSGSSRCASGSDASSSATVHQKTGSSSSYQGTHRSIYHSALSRNHSHSMNDFIGTAHKMQSALYVYKPLYRNFSEAWFWSQNCILQECNSRTLKSDLVLGHVWLLDSHDTKFKIHVSPSVTWAKITANIQPNNKT